MAIQFGNDKIKDIYVGSDKIKEVYYGSEKVWGGVESIQDGYWVHKDTNAVTYFGADADFITEANWYIRLTTHGGIGCIRTQVLKHISGLRTLQLKVG